MDAYDMCTNLGKKTLADNAIYGRGPRPRTFQTTHEWQKLYVWTRRWHWHWPVNTQNRSPDCANLALSFMFVLPSKVSWKTCLL